MIDAPTPAQTRYASRPQLFETGDITASDAAEAAVAEMVIPLETWIRRHVTGDWGAISRSVLPQNTVALRRRGTVISVWCNPGKSTKQVVISTDITAATTRVQLDTEYEAGQKGSPLTDGDRHVQELREREAALGAELDALLATRVDEMTLRAAKGEVRSCHDTRNYALRAGRAESAEEMAERLRCEQHYDALLDQNEQLVPIAAELEREKRAITQSRQGRETFLREQQVRSDARCFDLITEHDRDAKLAAGQCTELAQTLDRMQKRCQELSALGTYPNRDVLTMLLEALPAGELTRDTWL